MTGGERREKGKEGGRRWRGKEDNSGRQMDKACSSNCSTPLFSN